MNEQQEASAGKKQNHGEDRAQWFEELRFAKKQQWAVAAAAVTLLAAIFALQHSVGDPTPAEKTVLAVVITLVAALGCSFLVMLQKHIRETRLLLNRSDSDAALRGVGIIGALIGVVIVSALGVLYVVALRSAMQ